MGRSLRKGTDRESGMDFDYMDDNQRSDRVQRRNVLDEIFNAFQRLVLLIAVISFCVIMFEMIAWNDLIAVCIELSLLMIQIFIVAHALIPSMTLNPRYYPPGNTILATLEETKVISSRIIVSNWCRYNPIHKKHYVVLYNAMDKRGNPVSIRKTLEPGIFEKDLIDDQVCDSSSITELAFRDGNYLSAFPRVLIIKYHTRMKWWTFYCLPFLVVTLFSIACNLFYSSSVTYRRSQHLQNLHSILIFFGILYAMILIPLAYVIRQWQNAVNYGGKRLSNPYH
jgi:hypothetical protein